MVFTCTYSVVIITSHDHHHNVIESIKMVTLHMLICIEYNKAEGLASLAPACTCVCYCS